MKVFVIADLSSVGPFSGLHVLQGTDSAVLDFLKALEDTGEYVFDVDDDPEDDPFDARIAFDILSKDGSLEVYEPDEFDPVFYLALMEPKSDSDMWYKKKA